MRHATIGAIAAAAAGEPAPPELPELIDGLEGWISTTKGKFQFGDGTKIPGHGKAVCNSRNVADGFVLFSQATVGLQPTWDGATFDVPCVRSDGTQYLTISTSLTAPGLIIAAVALDSAATGFRAISRSRSTETPGATPARTPGR